MFGLVVKTSVETLALCFESTQLHSWLQPWSVSPASYQGTAWHQAGVGSSDWLLAFHGREATVPRVGLAQAWLLQVSED